MLFGRRCITPLQNSAFSAFPSGANPLCTAPWESKKLSPLSWCGNFWISVSSAEGISHQPIQNSVALFRGHRQNTRSHSPNSFVKKNCISIGHRDNVLARCDSIFPLLRCQEVWNKTCTQLSLSQILLQNPKNYSLGDVQRFCYHSCCDSTAIFDQISKSSNVYLSSSRYWSASSLVIFYQLPSVSKSRIPKNVWSVQSLIPVRLLYQY